MTDSNGRFVFQTLEAGTYYVRVEAPGYFAGGFGRTPASEAIGEIALQERQWFAGANAVLWKPGSISGTVRDESGEPLVDVRVRLMMAFSVAGRDQWAAGAVTQTDDRGAYRFAGLRPGRYVVHVPSMQITLPDGAIALYRNNKPVPLPAIRYVDGTGTMVGYFPVPPAGRGQVYPASFHPAARSLSTAGVIALELGSQRAGIDVSLAPVASVRVSGVVEGPAEAIAELPVRLMATGNESLGVGSETALTKTDSTGRFVFAQVPQGDYTVIAGRAMNEIQVDDGVGPSVAPSPANPFLERMSGAAVGGEPRLVLSSTGMSGDDAYGRVAISVGTESLDRLVVPTIMGVTMSGHALYDGADAPAAGRTVSRFGPMIRVDPADGDLTRTASFSLSHADSLAGPTFSIANVMPGRYRLLDQGNRDYRLVGATWNGQDLFATPLEVREGTPVTGIIVYLSTKHNAVSGVVRTADGKPSAGAVLIFPQDPNRWLEPGISAVQFRSLAVAISGTFSTENLIPGDYFIAAVPIEDRRRLLDVEFLKSLAPQARRITLGESSTMTVELRVIGGGR